jgi:hypothetical protein
MELLTYNVFKDLAKNFQASDEKRKMDCLAGRLYAHLRSQKLELQAKSLLEKPGRVQKDRTARLHISQKSLELHTSFIFLSLFTFNI